MKPEDILNKKNVISVELGTKVTGGVDTGEQCYSVKVAEKKDVAESDKIPSELDGLKTDVITGEYFRPEAVEPSNSGSAAAGHGDQHLPLKGGISIGLVNSGTPIATGTLGGFTKGINEGSLFGLTNNHVVGSIYDPATSDVDAGQIATHCSSALISLADLQKSNITFTQPSIADNGSVANLGQLHNVYPFNVRHESAGAVASNYVDAATITLDSVLGSNYPAAKIYDGTVLGDNPLAFPIFDFSNLPLNGAYELVKVGRTTGRTPRRSDFVNYPSITYKETYVQSGVAANLLMCDNPSYRVLAPFADTLKAYINDSGNSGSRQDFSNSGDSGSLVYIKWGESWYIFGLLFGGTNPSNGISETLLCRIDYVMKALGIGSGWTLNPEIQNDFTNLSDVSSAWGRGQLWDGSIIAASAVRSRNISVFAGKHAGGTNQINTVYARGRRTRKPMQHQLNTSDYSDITNIAEAHTFKVTVGAKTGGGNAYYINGIEAPELPLRRERTYKFDFTDVDLTTHPFKIKDSHTNTVLYTGSTTTNKYTVHVDHGEKDALTYYCDRHSDMGNLIRLGGHGTRGQSSSSSTKSSASSRSSRSSYSSSTLPLGHSSSSSKSRSSSSDSKSSVSSSSESKSSVSSSSVSSSSVSSSSESLESSKSSSRSSRSSSSESLQSSRSSSSDSKSSVSSSSDSKSSVSSSSDSVSSRSSSSESKSSSSDSKSSSSSSKELSSSSSITLGFPTNLIVSLSYDYLAIIVKGTGSTTNASVASDNTDAGLANMCWTQGSSNRVYWNVVAEGKNIDLNDYNIDTGYSATYDQPSYARIVELGPHYTGAGSVGDGSDPHYQIKLKVSKIVGSNTRYHMYRCRCHGIENSPDNIYASVSSGGSGYPDWMYAGAGYAYVDNYWRGSTLTKGWYLDIGNTNYPWFKHHYGSAYTEIWRPLLNGVSGRSAWIASELQYY